MWLAHGLIHAAVFQGGVNNPGASGSSSYSSVPGSSALRSKSIDNNWYRPQANSGTILHNVNMTTGQPVYSVPLGEIGIGKARFPIQVTYAGPIRQMYDADNERGPTSWVGYGWNFSTPFVAVNHKGTVTPVDDVFYCNLGPYGGGQMLQNSPSSFFLANDPTVRILPSYDPEGLIKSWEIINQDGVRMIFGNIVAGDSAERKLVRIGGNIIGSPYSVAAWGTMVNRWDISVMDSKTWGGAFWDRLEFRYARKDIQLSAGRYYTRESYIKEIVALIGGVEVQKCSFITADKEDAEFGGISAEKTLAQALIETKRLQRIEWRAEGLSTVEKQITFHTRFEAPSPYKKRLLESIQFEYRNHVFGNFISDPRQNWSFTYDLGANRHLGLKTISKPMGGKDEFVYGRPNYTYPSWITRTQQEASVRKLTNNGTEIGIVDGEPAKTRYENETVCSEQFCFIAFVDRNPNDAMTLEVWKNNGNYFSLATVEGQPFQKTHSSNYPNSIKLVPWNDNLFVVDSKGKQIWFYEWDGETFKLRQNLIQRDIAGTRTPVPAIVNGTDEINVFPGGDYFLVQDNSYRYMCGAGANTASARVYVFRKDTDGIWKDLYERECVEPVICNGLMPQSSEPYRRQGGIENCLEFNTKDLMISTSPSMFHIVVRGPDIILTYAPNTLGTGFSCLSNKYPSFNNYVHDFMYPNNWHHNITMPIQFGTDFWVILSKDNGGAMVWIDIMHYDGQTIRRVGGTDTYTANYEMFPKVWVSGEYIIGLNPTTGSTGILNLMKKNITTTNGVPSGMSFTSYTVATGVDYAKSIQVRTHPKAFTMEVYDPAALVSGTYTKPPIVVSNNYSSDIWEFDPALLAVTSPSVPFRKVSTNIQDAQGRRYYDIGFSATENLITAKSCQLSGGGVCTGTTSDRIQFATAVMTPGLGLAGNFLNKKNDVFNVWGTGGTYHPQQFVLSASSRIGAACMLNQQTHKVEYTLLQSMGEGFTRFPYQIGTFPGSGDINFVAAFKTLSNMTGNNQGYWTEYGFVFLPDYNGIDSKLPEYNTHLQSFVFANLSVITYSGSEQQTTPRSIKLENISHITDELENPIADQHLNKAGLMWRSRVFDMDGVKASETIRDELSRTEVEYYPPESNPNWPSKLFMIRQKKVTSTNWAENRSRQTKSVTYHNYRPENNKPLFTKTSISGNWYLTQTLFPSSGENRSRPSGEFAFRFTTEPPDATLASWTQTNTPYSNDQAAQKTLSAWKVDFDPTFPYEVRTSKVWRDVDPTLTDAQLKTGKDPVYNHNYGWEDRTVVEQRNTLGQPTEIRQILGTAAGMSKRTAFFYEAVGSRLVATISNSHLDDAAVLTAENGIIGVLDQSNPSRWTSSGTSFSFTNPHTGRASFRVVDNYGLTTNLRLKGVAGQGYDYIVSAWIYGDNANKPTMTVTRFRANGSELNTWTTQNPASGSYAEKQWQRYEIKITNAQLKGSENLFGTETSGDYLTVKIGTGAPASNSQRIVYVDNIACRSTHSGLSMSAYDGRGQLTHIIDNDNLLTTYEYDLFGNMTSSKDEQFRTYSNQASHIPGEND